MKEIAEGFTVNKNDIYTPTAPLSQGGDIGWANILGKPTFNIDNWNTAYGWGDHVDLYSLLNHTHDVADINDFDTEVTNNAAVAANTAKVTFPEWGSITNHTDIESAEITNKFVLVANGTGYVGRALLKSDISDLGTLTWEDLTGTQPNPVAHIHVEADITDLDKYTRADIDAFLTNSATWNTAYSWGDHSAVGYLTSFTEADPIFLSSAAYEVTTAKITNWDLAHSWGNHATQGYLTDASTFLTNANIGVDVAAESHTHVLSVAGTSGFMPALPTVPSGKVLSDSNSWVAQGIAASSIGLDYNGDSHTGKQVGDSDYFLVREGNSFKLAFKMSLTTSQSTRTFTVPAIIYKANIHLTSSVGEMLQFSVASDTAATANNSSHIHFSKGVNSSSVGISVGYSNNFIYIDGTDTVTDNGSVSVYLYAEVDIISFADPITDFAINLSTAFFTPLVETNSTDLLVSNNEFTGKNTFSSDVSFGTSSILNLTAASSDDVDVDDGSFYRLTRGVQITGFTAGSDGKHLIIVNDTGNIVTFVGKSDDSAVGNRLFIGNSVSEFQLETGGAITFIYNGYTEDWKLLDNSNNTSTFTDFSQNYIEVESTAHGFITGDFIHYSDTDWAKAYATDKIHAATHCVEKIDADNFNAISIGEIAITGLLDDSTAPLVANTYYYLSNSLAGKITSTIPTTDVVQLVFKTNSTTTGTVLIKQPYDVEDSDPTFSTFMSLLDVDKTATLANSIGKVPIVTTVSGESLLVLADLTLQKVLDAASTSTGKGISIDAIDSDEHITFTAGTNAVEDNFKSVLDLDADGSADLTSIDYTTNSYAKVNVSTEEHNTISLTSHGMTSAVTFVVSSDAGFTKFTDGRAIPTGIEYAADYSSTFTTKSLVSKKYTDKNTILIVNPVVSTGTLTVDFDSNSQVIAQLSTGGGIVISGATSIVFSNDSIAQVAQMFLNVTAISTITLPAGCVTASNFTDIAIGEYQLVFVYDGIKWHATLSDLET